MLSHSTSRTRRLCGAVAVAGVTLGLLGLTASGSDAAETMRAEVERATGVPLEAMTPTTLVAGALAPPEQPAGPASREPRVIKRKVHVRTVGKESRVTVVEDGRARTYEGKEANAWLAANPMPPIPSAPAVPAAPALPAVPAFAPPPPPEPHALAVPGAMGIRSLDALPMIASRRCATTAGDGRLVVEERHGGRPQIVICTDRIAATAARAQAASRHAELSRRDGLRAALDGLKAARASTEIGREAIDRSIRRLEAQLDTI